MTRRADLSHLPSRQQEELDRSVQILREEFDRAVALGTQPWKRGGRILKIILFGSYARDDWVDEPHRAKGYRSDFDLLIIVNHEKLTDIAEYWYVAEDRIMHDRLIGREVNIIVHDLAEVNEALRRGEYFWTDIVRDGILLYELPGHHLATPMPLTDADAYRMAERYFDEWRPAIDRALSTTAEQITKGSDDLGWRKDAAFTLHQATERAYKCFLLTTTLYIPGSHNIKFLRSLSEDKDPRPIEAWPRATRADRSRFQLLKHAYVEARYSPHYSITVEELETLMVSVRRLRDIVGQICQEWLDMLRKRLGGEPDRLALEHSPFPSSRT